MSLKLYTDVHVPDAITEGLARRHIDVLTSQDDGTREAEDEALLQRATDLRRLLFSQDQDLLRIASHWQNDGRTFAGLAFSPNKDQVLADASKILCCWRSVAQRVKLLTR